MSSLHNCYERYVHDEAAPKHHIKWVSIDDMYNKRQINGEVRDAFIAKI